MMEKHTCCDQIRRSPGWYIPCFKTAKYERDGNWYCGIHDPLKVKEREEKRAVKWLTKQANEQTKYRLKNAMEHFCEGLTIEFMETHRATEN